jgi:RNA polymerase sigma-70 factor, ECF subfamily
MAVAEDFEVQADSYRRELLAHCYQMLGSVHDAEDLVQETMLRAWRSADQFDPDRGSLRTWLHKIATNACLTALRARGRRPLPSGLAGPGDDPNEPLQPGHEVPWLQPFPDVLLTGDGSAGGGGGHGDDPATVLLARGSMRLAFVAALQWLPARQRAVLILREVFELSAAEVADTLGTSQAGVNSALQRARATLAASATRRGNPGRVPEWTELAEPSDPRSQALLDAYVAAFERADLAALQRLLTADVVMEMPPMLNWYAGRADYAGFIARAFSLRGTDWRMLPLRANGQPAAATYLRGWAGDPGYHLHTLQVFSICGTGICHNVVFQDEAVFDLFELDRSLPDS